MAVALNLFVSAFSIGWVLYLATSRPGFRIPLNAFIRLVCAPIDSQEVKPCPTFLYQFLSGCAAHDVNRGMVQVVDEKKRIGDVHAVQHVLAVAGRRNLLQTALRNMLETELVAIHARPVASNLTHSEFVAEHTLLRTIEHLRSCTADDATRSRRQYKNRHS